MRGRGYFCRGCNFYLLFPRSVPDPSLSMPDSRHKEGNHLGRVPIPGERHGCAWVASILNSLSILNLYCSGTRRTRGTTFGNTRRKEYATALEYICALLVMDPGYKVQFVMPGVLPCWWSKHQESKSVILFIFQVSSSSQFEYAWCLVRSRYPADNRKGIILLEDLF